MGKRAKSVFSIFLYLTMFLGNLSIILIIMAMFVAYEDFSAFYKLREKAKGIVVEA